MDPRSMGLQSMAGRAGNMLGSFDQGASATAGMYSPQTYYNLMPLGIKTLSKGGQRTSMEDIADQLLRRVFKGGAPTSKQMSEGRAEGSTCALR